MNGEGYIKEKMSRIRDVLNSLKVLFEHDCVLIYG